MLCKTHKLKTLIKLKSKLQPAVSSLIFYLFIFYIFFLLKLFFNLTTTNDGNLATIQKTLSLTLSRNDRKGCGKLYKERGFYNDEHF